MHAVTLLRVTSGPWMWRYLMNVLLRQRPTIFLLGIPARRIAIAAHNLIKWLGPYSVGLEANR
jgi:hypothetical protein